MAFSISMSNLSLLRTLNHWHQEIYLRPFFENGQSLLASQVNTPAKTFSHAVMNCVDPQIIVLRYVRSTMRSTLTLTQTAFMLTLLSVTLIWTYWLYVLLFYIVNIVLIIIIESYYVVYIHNIVLTLLVECNMATVMFFTQTNVL